MIDYFIRLVQIKIIIKNFKTSTSTKYMSKIYEYTWN